MKKPILMLFSISLLISQGCRSQPDMAENYKDVLLDGFSVAIPSDWQEVELSLGIADAVSDSEGSVIVVSYLDESDTAEFALIVMDMQRMSELAGDTWEGWDKLWQEQSSTETKKQYAQMVSDHIFTTLWKSQNINLQEIRMFTVENRDACEILSTAEREDIPVNENILFVFEEDKVGIVLIIVTSVDWSTFQSCWCRIRESARFEYAGE